MVNKNKLFFLLAIIFFAVLIAFVSAEIISNNLYEENQKLNEPFESLNNFSDLNSSLNEEILSVSLIVVKLINDSPTRNNSLQISSKGHGEGSSTVPVSNIDLSDQKENYIMKPGRLKFDFEGNIYVIQVRRVKEIYVDFLILKLEILDKEEDITAYKSDNSFSLSLNQEKKIDLNKDGIMDISIVLNDISLAGEYENIKSAVFSIEKIK